MPPLLRRSAIFSKTLKPATARRSSPTLQTMWIGPSRELIRLPAIITARRILWRTHSKNLTRFYRKARNFTWSMYW